MPPVRRLCECGGLRAAVTQAPLIDIAELARWLATSPRHVRRLVEEQRVPYLKIGHYVRFDPAEISDWFNKQRVWASNERVGDNEPIWVRRSPDGPRHRRDPALAKVPLVDYTTWWLEHRPELRPRTSELYSGLLRLHIEPYLGECAFGSLTTAEIRSWHAGMLQRGKPSPVTVAKAYRLLRCILNDAVEDGLLLRNPCTIRGAGVERSPERPVATIEQVYQLAGAIEERYRLMVLLGTFCGLRLGELVALRRDRIDVLHRRVIISEQGQELSDGTRYYGPPKTAAGVRSVALPPHLVVDVEDHLLRWVGPEPTALLFTGPKADELYRATFNAAWDRARRTVGMDAFHFHDLRHTGNTLAAGTGASTRELMARMGHASARAALVYQHASEERDVQIAERLSAMTDEALGRSRDRANDDESSHRSSDMGHNG